MLAWVLWHARSGTTPSDHYVSALQSFHADVRAAGVPGFLGHRTNRHDEIPWLTNSHEVYEDWYFVRDSAALDRLDEVATSEIARESHTRLARLAGVAVAGLYRLRKGKPLGSPALWTWVSKPHGTKYEPFIDALSSSGTVWSRQMVLGPTPEFCVEGNLPLSAGFEPAIIHSLRPTLIENEGGSWTYD